MNVCSEFHGNPFKSCYDIQLKKHKCEAAADPRGKTAGAQQRHRDSSFVNHECLYKLSWQCLRQVLNYFSVNQSGGPTDRSTPPYLEPRPERVGAVTPDYATAKRRLSAPIHQITSVLLLFII